MSTHQVKRPQVVVRPQWFSSWGWGVAGFFLLVLILWQVFDYGRARGGFDKTESLATIEQQQSDIQSLKLRERELQEQLAQAQTAATVDQRAAELVRQDVRASQDELAHLKEELDFYRSIVSPEDRARGIKIQNVVVTPIEGEQRYRYKVVIVQVLGEQRLKGRMQVQIKGSVAGEVSTLNANAYEAQPKSGHKLGFKSFQVVESVFQLPQDFQVTELHVIVSGMGKGKKTLDESYEWEQVLE